MMLSTDAAQFVNSMAVRPGWTVEAAPLGTGDIAVLAAVETVNSNQRYAPSYRGERFEGMTSAVVDVRELSRVELVGKVVALCLEKEAHEWREFARYQDPRTGLWEAPFHPHRADGQHNWATGMAAPRLAGSEE